MKRAIRWLIILSLIFGLGWWGSHSLGNYMKERGRIVYRETELTRGRIAAVVNATGTIQPILSVKVGSFVSGPIIETYVDFNSEVKENDLLAKVDPKIYRANLERDQANLDSAQAPLESQRATLATRKAEVKQAEARRDQAKNDKDRYEELQKLNKNFTSATEMDKYRYDHASYDALVSVANATVQQAEASIKQAE